MEENIKMIETLLETAKSYGKSSMDLAKLKALDKSSLIGSSIASRMIAMMLAGLCILFCGFGAALWLNDVLESSFTGFFIVAALPGLLAIIAFSILHRSIMRWFRDYMIKKTLQ
jgi:hypothetical protein